MSQETVIIPGSFWSALGSLVAYFYSLFLLFLPVLGQHVYFETSAVIITLIKLGKMLEARTKGRTGQAI